MGATNSTRKLTVDSIALLEMLEPNAAEIQAKAEVRARIEAHLAKEWPMCRVLAFGSSESGLGFGGSDLDIGVYFEDVDVDCQNHFTTQERIQILSTVIARLGHEFELQEFVQHARVPIVKLRDRKSGVACDVCVGSVHVLLNTALLKFYGHIDPRVRPLAFAIKYWASQRGINDSVNGTLSSYGFALLLIFFLQSTHAQSLLPPVSTIFHTVHAEKSISGVLQRIASLSTTGFTSTFGASEHGSVGALLSGFFRFYASEFNYEDEVVSIRVGSALSKATKWSRPVPWRLSIEDPFEMSHDVGRVIFSRHGQELLNQEFRRAAEMTVSGFRLEDICSRDESAWNWTATCYVCASACHKARECAQVAFRLDPTKAGRSDVAAVADCWYCGGTGHLKATCPLYAFLSIPNPSGGTCKVPPIVSVADTDMSTPSTPISAPIPIPMSKHRSRHTHSKPQAWDVHSRPHSPVRAVKKKKRPRHGSISSVVSSPEQERSRKYMLASAQPCLTARKCGNPSKRGERRKLADIPCIT